MKNKQKLFFIIGITVALISGFWFGQTFYEPQETASMQARVMVLETPRKLAIPALQESNGGEFDMTSLQGKWSLLFFGYTHCPDVCPSTLNTVAQAKQEFERAGVPFPQVVFVSIDPGRDNVTVLGEYVRYFDKDFIGATGEQKLLRAITVQTNSKFMVEPSENEVEYLVGHSLNLVLINPNVELVAVLSPTHSVESISNALQLFEPWKS